MKYCTINRKFKAQKEYPSFAAGHDKMCTKNEKMTEF